MPRFQKLWPHPWLKTLMESWITTLLINPTEGSEVSLVGSRSWGILRGSPGPVLHSFSFSAPRMSQGRLHCCVTWPLLLDGLKSPQLRGHIHVSSRKLFNTVFRNLGEKTNTQFNWYTILKPGFKKPTNEDLKGVLAQSHPPENSLRFGFCFYCKLCMTWGKRDWSNQNFWQALKTLIC